MRRHVGPLLLIAALSFGSLAACGDDGGGGDEPTDTSAASTDTTTAGDDTTDTTAAGGDTTDTTAAGGGDGGGDGSGEAASNPLVTEYCEQVAAYVDAAEAYSEDPEGTDLAPLEALFEDLSATLTELNAIMEDLSPADAAAVRGCAEDLVAEARP